MSKISDKILKELKLEEAETEWGFISTGLPELDSDLGGGLAKGKVVEIFGPESAAKTTLCLSAAASVQRSGGDVLFIDAEHAIDPAWAILNGVDWDEFGIVQPDSAEQALKAIEMAIAEGVDLVILDSVAAMSTSRELNGDLADANVGDKARLMSQSMRRICGAANKAGSTIVFINQIREKIGVMFGSPETTPGGRALKFHSSQRIDSRRIENIKVGEGKNAEIIGIRVKTKIVKNKVAAPFKISEYTIRFDIGIDHELALLEYAVKREVVEKSGSWFSFEEAKLGQGAAKSADFLRENPDVAKQIEAALVA